MRYPAQRCCCLHPLSASFPLPGNFLRWKLPYVSTQNGRLQRHSLRADKGNGIRAEIGLHGGIERENRGIVGFKFSRKMPLIRSCQSSRQCFAE